jgi:chemotaxis protein MotB
MARKGKGANAERGIVLRREEVVEGGHHGGAWKVAYADFVTAMMAFFLLMWLLNATTDAQKKGIADYFSPTNVLGRNVSGNGAPFGGHTPFDHGALASDRGALRVLNGPVPPPDVEDDDSDTPATATPFHQPGERAQSSDATAAHDGAAGAATDAAGAGPAGPATPPAARGREAQAGDGQARDGQARDGQARDGQARDGQARDAQAGDGQAGDAAVHTAGAQAAGASGAEPAKQEKAAFAAAAEQIRAAVRADPLLAELGRQLAIDMTPEGLRIQILDEDHQPMFASGSADPNDRARLLLQKVTPVLLKLTEDISIAGHTDATPYHGTDRTNWELSADRANATRRLLVENGLPASRIRSVTGNADRDPLLPADPFAAANRRIAIVVLRAAPAAPAAPATSHAP